MAAAISLTEGSRSSDHACVRRAGRIALSGIVLSENFRTGGIGSRYFSVRSL
jgi:hypothetical protein